MCDKATDQNPVTEETVTKTNSCIRIISLSDSDGPAAPVMITCGQKQPCTALEPPSPNCQETMISIHLLLSVEQQTRPSLTLHQLKEELCRNRHLRVASRPLPQYADENLDQLTSAQKVKTIAPVPVAINIDGVDMRFHAAVVMEGYFPQGLYLGERELRCYNIGAQDAYGEARIDEHASLSVTFGGRNQQPVLLSGMIDTGSGLSLLSFKAYQKLAAANGLILQQFETPTYAANNGIIRTIGVAENIKFQLGGHELQTTFIVLTDDAGGEDFLLGRNFLRAYNVLIDLVAGKLTIRDPQTPRLYRCQQEAINEESPFIVVLDQDTAFGPGERQTVCARVITEQPDELIFRNVMLTSRTPKAKNVILDDCLAAVTEGSRLVASLQNATAKDVTIKKGTLIGHATPTTFSLQPVTQVEGCASVCNDNSTQNFVFRIDSESPLSSLSSDEFSSFAQNFLSSTDSSEPELSETEKRKRTDPELLKPVAGPNLSSVLSSWGEGARDKLANLLAEYDDIFMKHKADIGRCKIAKHKIEIEPNAEPHREGARRMSPDKAAKANQEL